MVGKRGVGSAKMATHAPLPRAAKAMFRIWSVYPAFHALTAPVDGLHFHEKESVNALFWGDFE